MVLFLNIGVAHFIMNSINFFFRCFGLIPLADVPIVHELLIVSWIIGLITTLIILFTRNEIDDDYSIGVLVSCALFISQILTHITALIESYYSGPKLKQFYDGFAYIDRILELKLNRVIDRNTLRKIYAQELLCIHSILLADTLVLTYIHIVTQPKITVLYWYSFLSIHALRFRCTQVITSIISLNIRLQVIRNKIHGLVQRNSKYNSLKIITLIEISGDACMERVASLKLAYHELYKLLNILNDCFGWSLLSICSTYFIDFITNFYWIVVAKISNGPYEVYILNGGMIVSLILQLTVICWHCQECQSYSKHIGSSICKLAKPLGNTQYNNLVSAFSLQALHQKFVVSAKEFFPLNLDLLGNMFGSIVTYLVILIQFMLTERHGSRISVPNSSKAYTEIQNQTITN